MKRNAIGEQIMKILVLSDSHGHLNYMQGAIKLENPSLILHLGDNVRDSVKLESYAKDVPILSVHGNCDLGTNVAPATLLQEVEGVRIMMTHGHDFGVKIGLLRLELEW